MFKYPTFNMSTILTFLCIAGESYMSTVLWYGKNPGPYEFAEDEGDITVEDKYVKNWDKIEF